MATVAIVDYGGSNLRSVAKAIEHVAARGQRVEVTDSPAVIARAERVVFPGQGAIGECMRRLAARGLDAALRDALGRKPYLGICLGLQTLMGDSAEDGGTPGLGVFAGAVRRFAPGMREPATGERLKIPHMGWNAVRPTRAHPLWRDLEEGGWFYFVHSYYVCPEDERLLAGVTDYGVTFASALARGFVFATQFHPEKSQRAGLQLLANFLSWDGGDG